MKVKIQRIATIKRGFKNKMYRNFCDNKKINLKK
jgi:hypothetical protein